MAETQAAYRVADAHANGQPVQLEPLLVDEREAARLLGASGRTLYEWRRQGLAPGVVPLPGAAVRYSLVALRAWIIARTKPVSTGDESLPKIHEPPKRGTPTSPPALA